MAEDSGGDGGGGRRHGDATAVMTRRSAYVRLLGIHVQLLKPFLEGRGVGSTGSGGNGLCLPNGRHVRLAMLAGIVTEVDKGTHFVAYKVDDGTAEVPCIVWRRDESERHARFNLELGCHVLAWGAVTVFRGKRQLTTHGISEITAVEEAVHWAEAMAAVPAHTLQPL
ncbi:hypothetical protein PTSG_12677 [Salpingoeca rosetta]|uniref:CST complex subunit STN1 n=1 Tax=Salpingoeca rosetta (strain ATCC 50818 / BSB-021) TaxID=946362 RepID=F2UHW4_SALR5|nr:uncharacterized protein PTSG_12677 [Salpingoeca rosetta]EGD76713.1 hypothetical protein PTSG_12677 [Salpingoeca rosetta]|eukprot:XP_004991085.1 hypothetical protein PTSG_12677 [Salpingoeca rosetta]